MAFIKNILLLAVICTSFFAINASPSLFPIKLDVTINPSDLAVFAASNNVQLQAFVTQGINNCVSLTEEEQSGTFVGNTLEYVKNLIVEKLIQFKLLPSGKYSWGQVSACKKCDGQGGWIFDFQLTLNSSNMNLRT